MDFQPLILTLLFPFFGALVSGLVALKGPRLCRWIVLGSLFLGLICSLATVYEVLNFGTISYGLGGWEPPYAIEFKANIFNSSFLCFIYFVAILNLIHSTPVLRKLYPRGPQFYTLYLLLVTSFIGMSLTADVFNIYVFLEISSLTSYALIGRGDGRACRAAFNYLLMGTIGASFYLLGVGYLYIKTGSLNISDIASILPQVYSSSTVQIAFVFILLGLMIKMSAFPMHTWLPNAYTYCPQPTVGLIAPLATKVSLFLMIKIIVEVFSFDFVNSYFHFSSLLVNMTAVGIIIVCIIAISQKSLIKSFTYIVIAEIGYIFGGFWLQNQAGLIGAGYHLFCDIILTLAIFLFVGSIRNKYKTFTLDNLKNFFSEMPFTAFAFVITSLSLIGVPPTSGFVSKIYLLSGAVQAEQWLFLASLIFASITGAIIFFRIIEKSFFNDSHEKKEINESSLVEIIPLYLVAFALVWFGIMQESFVETVILPYLGA